MKARTCPNCDATVAEEEQFCPACGQWVDPLGEDVFEPFALEEGPPPDHDLPPPEPDVETPPEVSCPSCGTLNPAYNRHCEECGARISQGPLPVAPQPAVRTTAGARALMVLAAVIMVVALAALLVNLFGSDDEVVAGPEDTTTTTATDTVAIQELQPVSVTASTDLPGFEADHLIDDDATTSWNDASLQGEGAELTFFFGEPVQITSIVIQNLTDEGRFHRNFRIRGYQIVLDDLDQTISGELEDTMQPQTVQVPSLRTTRMTLRVSSTYPAESWEGEAPFQELALQEIKFFGRPAPPPSGDTGGGEGDDG